MLLLEGGGFDYDPQMQELYRGEIVGQPYYPLQNAALHQFGGTTGHWAGFCSNYDPIDFERRDWVPHSGWPISRADLDPFYARAQQVLKLGPYKYDAADWRQDNPDRVPLLPDSPVVWTKMWQFSPTRFGEYRNEIVNAPNIHLYTHANVVEVEASDGLQAVQSVRIRGFDGKEQRARAKRFVLSCHTIQNARLLLASNRQARTGLGNGNDLVGRYFMEHFEMPGGELALAKPETTKTKIYAMSFPTRAPRGELSLSPAAQREHRILNGTASLEAGSLGDEVKSTFQFIDTAMQGKMRAWEKSGRSGPPPIVAARMARAPKASGPPRFYHLATRQEQAPNPDSRVTLSKEKDALGMPRTKLDWRVTDLDKRSIRTFYEVLGREMGRTGMGRVQIREWLLGDDKTWPSFISGGWHHMGTTRMNSDPKQGVVDANSRVHGFSNLFIGGASVYPTAGSANPTLTLVALSLRLADHLKGSG